MTSIYSFVCSLRRCKILAVCVFLVMLLFPCNLLFDSKSGGQSFMPDLKSVGWYWSVKVNEVEKPGNKGQVEVGTNNKPSEGVVNSNPNASVSVRDTIDVQKLEMDCIDFYRNVLKSTNTTICNQALSKEGLVQEIMSNAGEWKRKHLKTLKKIVNFEDNSCDKLVCIEIGSRTGAASLLSCMHSRKAISSDPYLENLRVLQRALKLMRRVPRVKQLWYTVTNTSTLNVDAPIKPGVERKLTLDDITKYYMLPDETVHLWVSQEGYELEVLQGGHTFFNSMKVCFAVVDFSQQRTRETGLEIIKFMNQYNLLPFEDFDRKKSLKTVHPSEFPSSVVFRSNGAPPCKIR